MHTGPKQSMREDPLSGKPNDEKLQPRSESLRVLLITPKRHAAVKACRLVLSAASPCSDGFGCYLRPAYDTPGATKVDVQFVPSVHMHGSGTGMYTVDVTHWQMGPPDRKHIDAKIGA